MEKRVDNSSLIHWVGVILLLIPLIISGILVTLGSLKILVQVYQASLVVGLVLTIVALPMMLLFAGSWIAMFCLSGITSIEYDGNKWEYWGKTTLFSLGSPILVWASYFICGYLFLLVSSWLIN